MNLVPAGTRTRGTTVALTALTAGLLAIDDLPNTTVDRFGQAATALSLTSGTALAVA